MDFSSSTSEQELQDELRDLIRTEIPADFSQPLRRLPMGLTHTEAAILRLCKHQPIAGLFYRHTPDALIRPSANSEPSRAEVER